MPHIREKIRGEGSDYRRNNHRHRNNEERRNNERTCFGNRWIKTFFHAGCAFSKQTRGK